MQEEGEGERKHEDSQIAVRLYENFSQVMQKFESIKGTFGPHKYAATSAHVLLSMLWAWAMGSLVEAWALEERGVDPQDSSGDLQSSYVPCSSRSGRRSEQYLASIPHHHYRSKKTRPPIEAGKRMLLQNDLINRSVACTSIKIEFSFTSLTSLIPTALSLIPLSHNKSQFYTEHTRHPPIIECLPVVLSPNIPACFRFSFPSDACSNSPS